VAGDVRPFVLSIPDEALDDLRDRLSRTRPPENENVSGHDGSPDWSQGPPRSYVVGLLDHRARGYDWRRVEAELNAHGHALCEVDELDLHLLHVRSPRRRPAAHPHPWLAELGHRAIAVQVMDALADPPGPELPAFHVVAPSLPGFGFGGKPTATGWNVDRTADAWATLMTRLGYDRFFAAGGDWGGRVTAALARRHPDRVAALHSFTPYVVEPNPPGQLTAEEERWLAATQEFRRVGGGYSLEQSTPPRRRSATPSPTLRLRS